MKKIAAVILALTLVLSACTNEQGIDAVLSSESSSSEISNSEGSYEVILEIEDPVLSSVPDYFKSENPVFEGEKYEPSEVGSTVKNYVIRANSSSNAGESFLWQYAVNTYKKGECPVLVFKSAAELENFVEKLGKYFQIGSGNGSLKELLLSCDEEFFSENTLILGHILANSGSVRYTVNGVSVSGKSCTVNIKTEAPQTGTMDMANWFVVVEIPSNEVKDCTDFALTAKSAATSFEFAKK